MISCYALEDWEGEADKYHCTRQNCFCTPVKGACQSRCQKPAYAEMMVLQMHLVPRGRPLHGCCSPHHSPHAHPVGLHAHHTYTLIETAAVDASANLDSRTDKQYSAESQSCLQTTMLLVGHTLHEMKQT